MEVIIFAFIGIRSYFKSEKNVHDNVIFDTLERNSKKGGGKGNVCNGQTLD